MKKLFIFIILPSVLTGCRHGIYSSFLSEKERQAEANLLDQQLEAERQKLDIPQEMWGKYIDNFKQRKCGGWDYQWGKNWRYWAIKDAEEYFNAYIDRQAIIKQFKKNNPLNWQKTLLKHDISQIVSNRASTPGPEIRLAQIQNEKLLILQDSTFLQNQFNDWNSKYQSFLSGLDDERLKKYNGFINEINTQPPEGIELFKREVQKLLSKEEYEVLLALGGEKLELDNSIQTLLTVANQLLDDENSLKKEMQIRRIEAATKAAQASQSFWNAYNSYLNQRNWDRLNNNLMNISNRLNGSGVIYVGP